MAENMSQKDIDELMSGINDKDLDKNEDIDNDAGSDEEKNGETINTKKNIYFKPHRKESLRFRYSKKSPVVKSKDIVLLESKNEEEIKTSKQPVYKVEMYS